MLGFTRKLYRVCPRKWRLRGRSIAATQRWPGPAGCPPGTRLSSTLGGRMVTSARQLRLGMLLPVTRQRSSPAAADCSVVGATYGVQPDTANAANIAAVPRVCADK